MARCKSELAKEPVHDEAIALLKQYGFSAFQFSGMDNALYEWHFVFDKVLGLRLLMQPDARKFSATRIEAMLTLAVADESLFLIDVGNRSFNQQSAY